MDILRRELNEVYARQHLEQEQLPRQQVDEWVAKVAGVSRCTGICCVVTDISADCSYYIPGVVAGMLGLDTSLTEPKKLDSSDEDFLYARILPVDLAELRMLEYEFFKAVDAEPPSRKLLLKAFANIAMHGLHGVMNVSKTTQVLALSPLGKIWLVLCCYDFAPPSLSKQGINPMLTNLSTGECLAFLDFANRRADVLTKREKQVLRLIADGRLSKEIATILGISQNTVNRHRQNILSKLSVDNAMEAVVAARAMGLTP